MKILKRSMTFLAALVVAGAASHSIAEDCAIVFSASAPESMENPKEINPWVYFKADQTTVELMSRVMRKSGYKTVIRLAGTGATKSALRNAIAECSSKLKDGDRFCLYALGHGGPSEFFMKPLFEKSNWSFVAGDQTKNTTKPLQTSLIKSIARIQEITGREFKNWSASDKDLCTKDLFAEEESREILRKYAATLITDTDLRNMVSKVPTSKATILVESCHSGLGLNAFESSRNLGSKGLSNFASLAKQDILPGYDFTDRKSISIAESILGQGSEARSLPNEIVVMASVQGAEPAGGWPWMRQEVSDLGYGDDWIPSTSRPMLGLFTYFLARTWSNFNFRETPWSNVYSKLNDSFVKWRIPEGPGQGKSTVQRPQIAARHLDKPFIFKTDTSSKDGQERTETPQKSTNPAASVSADFFTKNFLSLFNSDRSILDLNLGGGQLKYKAGDTLEFKLRTGAPGYLFVINFDTMGTIQLLPWAGLDLNGSTSDLLRAASCTSGQTLELGAGKYRLFAKDIGREKVKGILFRDRTLAEKFVNAWKAISPKTEEDARRLDARAIGVQVVKLSDFYTIDLEFEVQGG